MQHSIDSDENEKKNGSLECRDLYRMEQTSQPSTPRAKKAPTQLNIKWNDIED